MSIRSRCSHSLPRLVALATLLSAGLLPAEEPVTTGRAVAEAIPLNATGSTPSTAVAPQAPASPASTAAAPAGGDIYAGFIGKKFTQGPGGAKKIALTFDDGPHPKTTARMVEILKRENVRATFFMLGKMASEQPSLAKMVADAGFEIGSHSFTHPDLKKKGLGEVREEIIGAQDSIQQVTGQRPRLFRPPYGNISESVKKVCTDDNLVIVNWSIDPRDWMPGTKGDTITQKVVNGARPGAIVCMHDTKEQTVQALPSMIAGLREKGYEFVTVSELIEDASKAPAPSADGGAGDVAGDEGAYGGSATEQLIIPLDATVRN